MEIIKKILGITKTTYKYRKPDPALRPVSTKHGSGGVHTVTGKRGLYNQNLTVGELSILRTMIWEYKAVTRDDWEYRRFLEYIHSWMFTDAKQPVLHADIIQDIEEGVPFEERLFC